MSHCHGPQRTRCDGHTAHRGGHPELRLRLRSHDESVSGRTRRVRRHEEGGLHRQGRARRRGQEAHAPRSPLRRRGAADSRARDAIRGSDRPRDGRCVVAISAVRNRLCSMEDPAHEAGERIGIIGVDEEAYPAECVELPSTTERRRSREGSSPRSRRGTDPLAKRYSGTPSRRATWAQSCSKARAGALASANAVTGIRRGPICSTSVA